MLSSAKKLATFILLTCSTVSPILGAAAAAASAEDHLEQNDNAALEHNKYHVIPEISEQFKRNMRYLRNVHPDGSVRPLLARHHIDSSVYSLFERVGSGAARAECARELQKPRAEQELSHIILAARHVTNYNQEADTKVLTFSSQLVALSDDDRRSVAYQVIEKYLIDKHPEIVLHADADLSGGITRTMYRVLTEFKREGDMRCFIDKIFKGTKQLFTPSPLFRNWTLLSGQHHSYPAMTEQILKGRVCLDWYEISEFYDGTDSEHEESAGRPQQWVHSGSPEEFSMHRERCNDIAYIIDRIIECELAKKEHELAQSMRLVDRKYAMLEDSMQRFSDHYHLRKSLLYADAEETAIFAALAAMMELPNK